MNRFITVSALLFLIALPIIALAQPGLPPAPQSTPLGGIELLAAAGGAYALKKLRDKRQD